MRISLIMATLNRSTEIGLLLDSLQSQTFRDFELIIVDQNADNRVGNILLSKKLGFPVLHLRPSGGVGSSWARNIGAKSARGDILGFPDDDCTYPSWLLDKVVRTFEKTGADCVNGRAADEQGRSINGRFLKGAGWIDKADVFRAVIEWMSFCKRSAFEAIGGYNEEIGVAAVSPWQSCEGPDKVLRMIARQYRAYYDDGIYGHHPEVSVEPMDIRMQRKFRGYGRGMGYVIGKHKLGIFLASNAILRPLGGFLVSKAKGDPLLSFYYLNTLMGRVEGYLDGRRIH